MIIALSYQIRLLHNPASLFRKEIKRSDGVDSVAPISSTGI